MPISANPFTPAPGARPIRLVGTASGLAGSFARRVDTFNVNRRNTLLTGVRGTGKSALLNEMANRAREKGWIVARRTLEPGLNNEADFAQTFSNHAREVLDELSGLERAKRRVRAARELVTIDVPVPQTDSRLTFRLSGSAEPMTLQEAMGQSLQRIGTVARDASRWDGVVFIFDDAQYLFDRPGHQQFPLSALSNAFIAVQGQELPVMLVLAGLPSIRRQLAEGQQNAPRAFDTEELTALSLKQEGDEASDAALAVSVIGAAVGITFDRSAAEQLAADAAGYLAGIQALGYRVVEHAYVADVSDITRAFYDERREDLLRFLDTNLYLAELERTPYGLRPLMFAAADVGETFALTDLTASVGDRAGQIASLEAAGILYEAGPGRYGFTYGGFREFLARQDPIEQPS